MYRELFPLFNTLIKEFNLKGKLSEVRCVSTGNINDTYVITTLFEGGERSYLVQRVNHNVFCNPERIAENVCKVTDHIESKLRKAGVMDIRRRVLRYYRKPNGRFYHITEEGNYWRVLSYVYSSVNSSLTDIPHLRSAGLAFGEFQQFLADFPSEELYETIPDFHNTKKRLDTLFAHVEEDPCDRVESVKTEIEYIASVREKAAELSVMFANGEIPKRVTHNDTKCNNVLFNKKTKEPIVVIDLDTIMPGMSMYDFADAVRFIANTSVEDEPDISKVFFDTGKFRAFAKGFIGATHTSLEPVEISNLVKAAFSITIELASRFLDDYITGDKYFKCRYPKHNLVRTRCQLELAKDIERKWEELEWIVRDVIEKLN